jgi:D-alanine-D-alanine ligase
MTRRFKILIVNNLNPGWPASDIDWSRRMVRQLSGAFKLNGWEHVALEVFESLDALAPYDPREWLIWNWCEELGGQPWTDAAAAAEMEARGFAFTGSAPDVLAFAMDRENIKARLRAHGLPTLPARRLTTPQLAAEWMTFPAIVKGCTQHGSFGIEPEAVVHTTAQLADRIAWLRRELDCDALVEPFLDTREFHVAVLGNGDARALPPVEYDYGAFADPEQRIFAYSYKHDETAYGYHAVKMRSPAPQDKPGWRARLEEVGLATYKAFGLTDYGRIDLRMLGDEPQVLDVNPNCDIDFTSALMTSAKAEGLAYHDVVAEIVGHAAERMPG